MSTEIKSRNFNLRVTPTEQKQLHVKAAENGFTSTSEYLRHIGLNTTPTSKEAANG